MKAEWFNPEIDNWSTTLTWTAAERRRVGQLLCTIAEVTGGEICWDIPKKEGLARSFAIRTANDEIQRRMNEHARACLQDDRYELYPKKEKANKGLPKLPFGTVATLSKRVEINSASLGELERLPGIGPKTAQRIVGYRSRRGPFGSIDELRKIEGVGEAEFQKFSSLDFLHSGPGADCRCSPRVSRSAVSGVPELSRFIKDPSLPSYIRLLEKGIRLWHVGEAIKDAKTELIEELARVAEGAQSRIDFDRASLPTLASEVAEEQVVLDRYEEICSTATEEAFLVGRANTRYREWTNKALDSAKSTVDVAMFFFSFSAEKGYPTRPLADALVAAKKRGVTVRVLLDRDRETDVFNSREINKPISEFLAAKGVEVRWDLRYRALHSKLVVIDDHMAIVGSHNWTAGSIFQYYDQSAFIVSDALVSRFAKRFDKLWKRARKAT